jgi:hypothetical protein
MNGFSRVLLALGLLGACAGASAHSFGTIYNLPVPFWMYAYGAAGALLVSFVVVGFFVNVKSADVGVRTYPPGAAGPFLEAMTGPRARAIARGASVFFLALTIVTGIFGARSAFTNFNMTFFWIIFVLGFTYLTALIGDVWSVVNPWRVLCEWIERVNPDAFRARVAYPARLGYYPAVAFYIAFIWMELFAGTQPRSLSVMLLAYTAINLAGAAIVGKQAWFRYCEFFSVFLRIVAMIAPVEKRDGKIVLRQPFMGLVTEDAKDFSALIFILFMLSSTAFDGIRETLPWVQIFWREIYPLLTPLGAGMKQPYLFLVNFYYYWQWLSLALSPFFYLAIYLFFIWLTKLVTRSPLGVRELALKFAYSLVPIAFVYNVTHYYTLIVSQGFSIVRLVSDPFGLGWNLFGTADWLRDPVILDAGTVWHTQVFLILFGHIVSVYLAHIVALRVFPDSRRAILSQLPMLVLMVVFTTLGLWILSLPIASGAVIVPPPAS